jgi:hypothetical protein
MTVIIECIGWLMDVNDINDARWKPEINRTPNIEANLNYFNIGSSNSKRICETFRNSFSFFAPYLCVCE